MVERCLKHAGSLPLCVLMDKKQFVQVRGYELKRITFVPAKNPDAHSIKPADLGFILLNDPVEVPKDEMGGKNGLHAPLPAVKPRSHELFRAEDVPMQWKQQGRLGTGFRNLGNTCFMNSVLQCLLHTPPLSELLLSNRQLTARGSGGGGDSHGYDPISITRQLLQDSMGKPRRQYVSPEKHARTMKKVSRSFRHGRQEDAHEYLIALLDAMHERAIAGVSPKPPPEVEFTSFIYRIFGGKIRSQVKCSQCDYESNTYDPFLDLSLEINQASSVEKALKRFTAGETLDGANQYKCPKQNRGVRAVKRMTIEVAPQVLVVQLKRFEFSLSGRKISKQVEFSTQLDLSPYMSHHTSSKVMYDLYGVLVHQGHSMHSGHYFCFIKSMSGDWHKFDDTQVNLTAERNVLGQHAYILFYIKRQPKMILPKGVMPPGGGAAAAAAPRNGQQQPKQQRQPPPQQQQQPRKKEPQQQPSLLMATGNGPVVAALKSKAAKRKREQQQQQLADEAAPVVNGSSKRQKTSTKEQRHKRRDASLEDDDDVMVGAESSPRNHLISIVAAADGGGGGESEHTASRSHVRNSNGVSFPPRSPSRVTLGRRGKRLEETKGLVRRMSQANGTSTATAAAGSQNSRKLLAALKPKEQQQQQQEKEKKKKKRKASSMMGGGGIAADDDKSNNSNKNNDSTSFGSAVSAPDWPPMKSSPPAAVNDVPVVITAAEAVKMKKKAVVPTTAAPTTAGVAFKSRGGAKEEKSAAIQDFLRAGTKATMGLDSWDEIDVGEKKKHDRLLHRAGGGGGGGRRHVSDYDEEYDRGKVKKVRKLDEDAHRVDSSVFDAVYQSQKVHGVQTEFRGKKKRRAAEMAAGGGQRQYKQQGSRERGGRGGGGNRGRGGGGRGGGRGRGGSREREKW